MLTKKNDPPKHHAPSFRKNQVMINAMTRLPVKVDVLSSQ